MKLCTLVGQSHAKKDEGIAGKQLGWWPAAGMHCARIYSASRMLAAALCLPSGSPCPVGMMNMLLQAAVPGPTPAAPGLSVVALIAAPAEHVILAGLLKVQEVTEHPCLAESGGHRTCTYSIAGFWYQATRHTSTST